MKQIKTENLNKTITDNFNYSFDILEAGLYAIEIFASAQDWWHNLKSRKAFFNDDNLAVKLDGRELPKLNGESGLFDGEAAWNGNNLKGLGKTQLLICQLTPGSHQLSFLAQHNPILESITLFQIIDGKSINCLPKGNNPPQDGDRRQWLTITIIGFSLKYLSVIATARKYPGDDDDDVKLVIDGQVQKNEAKNAHRDWYWCGKILDGKKREFSKELNLPLGLHYLELWADRSPNLHSMTLSLRGDETHKIPTVDNPKWTGDYNDDTEQIILARAIWGEARGTPKEGRTAIAWSIKNRVDDKKNRWGKTYHEVILQRGQYSAFWEKSDKDPNRQALRDPIGTAKNQADIDKWKETYQIAGGVINNGILDPTNGANHYYDDSISPPSWATPSKLKIKIGRLYFYEL